MDGVLLVGPGTHPGVYRMAAHDALADLGVRDLPAAPADLAAVLEGSAYDPSMADACAALGIDVDAWWAARERHASRRANARVRSGARATDPDAAATLTTLARERRLGLVSNNRLATASFVAAYRFPGRFEVVIGRRPTIEDYRRRKPDPTFIERALARLDADGGVYVGDRWTDVTAAHRAGLDPVLIERPHTAAAGEGGDGPPADATPAVTIDSLSALPAAIDSIRGDDRV
ncbi:HAD-IA family hydrolase [Halorubrum sp. JWXQ-INN 858]|nr:HAD-IA family hydrolase [Halorubrum sp. JWXQ-INN 858]